MNKLFKKISVVFLALIFAFSAVPSPLFNGGLNAIHASAISYGGSCGDEVSWSFNIDTGALTVSGNGETYDYVPLNTPWNIYRDEIKSVIIEEGVTSVGSHIFYGCTSLTDIIIPASVNKIGTLAFEECTALESISVSDDSLYFFSDGNGVLYSKDKTELIQYPAASESTSYTVAEGVKTISESAFAYSINLTSVSLPDSVTEICNNAFRSCENLAVVSVPANLVSLGDNAFRSTAIRSVSIPSSAENIGENAFGWCFDLKSIAVDENNKNYSSDEYGILFNKSKTELIKYPNNCKETSYSIPDGVTSVSDNAFENCYNLQSVTIPDSVISIGEGVFFNCYLKEIAVDKANQNYSNDEFGVLLTKDKTNLIQYPIRSEKASYKVPEGVSIIGKSAFHNARNLESIIISDGVKAINDGAFLYCTNLEFVHIPDSVTEIAKTVFNGKTAICSESENAYAKEYADANGYEFSVCANHNANGISISETSVKITNKQTYQLTATVTPDNAADKSVAWSSDNESVATVDSNGLVTALSAGSATVTVKATDGGYAASCAVTVEPRYFNITWIIDETEKTEKVAEGAAITAPETPEKDGYSFTGWSAEIPDTMPENDLIFKAKWSVNSYNAVFDANGGEFADGSTVKTLPVEYNTEIYAPRTPEKLGYEFTGWTPELGIMDSVNGKEFTATWKALTDTKYTVETYIMNLDGSYSVSTEELEGTTDTTANAEYKLNEGFILNDEKSVLSGNIDADGSLILKVYIDRISYSISLNGNEMTVLFGEEIAEPEKPAVPEGHIQEGWVDENGNTVEFPLTVGLNLPSSVTANFVKQSYKVTWTVDGVITEEIYEFDEAISKPSDPEKTGYTFEGWSPEVPDNMPSKPLDFTAVWTANSYDAVFDANSGAWSDGETSKTVTTEFDAEISALEAPEKAGYIFSGWSPEVGIMNDINGKKFTATWIASIDTRYTVEIYTMETDGNYTKAVQTLKGATDSTANVEYTVEEGFELNEEKSILSGIITADNSLVLKVYVDRKTYTVTTISDGIGKTENYLYGAIISLTAPEKDGYTFTGWDKTVPSTMPAENLTFTASFIKNKYICSDCGNEFDDEDLYNDHLAYELSKKNIRVSIKNNPKSKTIKYGETLKLTAITSAVLPEGTSIAWYIDGAKKGEGETFNVTFESGTKTVTVKIIDENGKSLKDADGNEISASEEVTVKAGFFQKLISFFKNLFGANREIVQ